MSNTKRREMNHKEKRKRCGRRKTHYPNLITGERTRQTEKIERGKEKRERDTTLSYQGKEN